MMDLPKDNLCYPVLVEINGSTGSGFYFRNKEKIFLVTALHVLFRVEDKTKPLRGNDVTLTSYDEDLNNNVTIELKIDLRSARIRKNDLVDIALIEISDIKNPVSFSPGVIQVAKKETQNIVVAPPDSLKKFQDILVSNEVFILGYPSSLGNPYQSQIEPRKPLLRKGIVAGLNTTNETIILDCPVYFGNSGGVVIEVERFPDQIKYSVIGVVSQLIPFIEQLQSVQLGYINQNYENSGYSVAVPIDTILELTNETPE